MYRWQTLTLARAERILSRGDRVAFKAAILDAVRDYLYRIGQRHFPEPDVTDPPRSAAEGSAVALHWGIDGRDLWVYFREGGKVDFDAGHPDGIREHGGIDLGPDGLDEIREAAHWVLFGERPPKPVAAPARVPRPGDPLSLHHPESVADRRRPAP